MAKDDRRPRHCQIHGPTCSSLAQAARTLDVTPMQALRLYREGKLQGGRDAKGEYHLAVSEIEKYRAERGPSASLTEVRKIYAARRRELKAEPLALLKRRGLWAAECFRCFEAGMTVNATIVRTELPWDFVREAWVEWKTPVEEAIRKKAEAAEAVKREAEERAWRRQQDAREARETRERIMLAKVKASEAIVGAIGADKARGEAAYDPVAALAASRKTG